MRQYLPSDQIVFHICKPWGIDREGKNMLIWETIIYRGIIILILYTGKKVSYYIILSRSVKHIDIKFLQ
jgi:hypothetical protein